MAGLLATKPPKENVKEQDKQEQKKPSLIAGLFCGTLDMKELNISMNLFSKRDRKRSANKGGPGWVIGGAILVLAILAAILKGCLGINL